MKISIIIFSLIISLMAWLCLTTAMANPPEDQCRSNPQLVSAIYSSGGNSYKTTEFVLTKNRILRLYAIGEGNPSRMLVYGGIENRETGQLVWVMDFLSTEDIDKTREIRKVDRLLPLRAGTYRLHFKSDPASLQKKSIQTTTGSHNIGIWLFDVTAHHLELLDNFLEKTTHPEKFGWSSIKLSELNHELKKYGTDALMLITDGKIIFEYGNTTNIMRSHSMRKSLLSALYGIYVAEGKIDLNATLEKLNITECIPLTIREKQATVLDLIKARSGIYIPAAAESSFMRKSRPQRGSHQPSTFWYYNNWDFNVLGTIFRQETREDLFYAFKRRIADPIGMQDFILGRQAYSYEKKLSLHPSYPFLISARDMAKFGQLFLQQGRWNDNQIIPQNWVTTSTASYSHTNRYGIGYGYMWWILTEDSYGLQKGSYFADGYGGQRLYVIPHLNSVIVHRINVKIPDTNILVADLSPDAVIKRIMKAYTGQKVIREKSVLREKKNLVNEKHLLDTYGRSSIYYGKSFNKFRIWLWVCAIVLSSSLVIRTIIYLMRKASCQLRFQEDKSSSNSLYTVVVKWITTIDGLTCSVYICTILTIPHAFEYLAMVGMPDGLALYQKALIHIPKIGVLLTTFLMVANIFVWVKRYWTVPERIHFVLITTASVVFTYIAYDLNLIILV